MMYLFLIILGLLPSFIWLVFYLRKDANPEPNKMVLKIFLYGMLSTMPIIAFALWANLLEFSKTIAEILAFPIIVLLLYIMLWALIEEFLKYLVVKNKVLADPEFDEPTDAMLYMIISGLGFAALENILILFGVHPFLRPVDILTLIAFRFVTATLLHALCSGVLGFYLALSFSNQKNRLKLLLIGLGIATLLHGFYNLAIIGIEPPLSLFLVFALLIILIVFASWGFKRLKRLKSICKNL